MRQPFIKMAILLYQNWWVFNRPIARYIIIRVHVTIINWSWHRRSTRTAVYLGTRTSPSPENFADRKTIILIYTYCFFTCVFIFFGFAFVVIWTLNNPCFYDLSTSILLFLPSPLLLSQSRSTAEYYSTYSVRS